MTISVHAPTKLMAAMMAAGVVAAAPVVTKADPEVSRTLSNIAVRPASVVTDALLDFSTVVDAGISAIAIPIDLIVSLPFDTVYTAVSALQDPAVAGSVLSWFAQRYLNPVDAYPLYAYPWDFKVNVLEPIAGLLPSPLSDTVIAALNS